LAENQEGYDAEIPGHRIREGSHAWRKAGLAMTWVLVLIIYNATNQAGMSTVPGYQSLDACKSAGEQLAGQDAMFKGTALSPATGSIEFRCIPGPRRS
jgi:hypothetical protein